LRSTSRFGCRALVSEIQLLHACSRRSSIRAEALPIWDAATVVHSRRVPGRVRAMPLAFHRTTKRAE
jgi:hypothetical protein